MKRARRSQTPDHGWIQLAETIFAIGKSMASLYHRDALNRSRKICRRGEYEDRDWPVRSLTLDRFGGSGQRAEPGRACAPLLAKFGPEFPRQVRRSLCEFLPVFLRPLAEEQSHSLRPNLLERLRQTLPGQSEIPARNSGSGSKEQRYPRRGYRRDWRLLCRLYRRAGSRKAWHRRPQAAVGSYLPPELHARVRSSGCQAAALRGRL